MVSGIYFLLSIVGSLFCALAFHLLPYVSGRHIVGSGLNGDVFSSFLSLGDYRES